MDKIKKFLPCLAIIIIIGGVMFYSGMKYGESQSSNSQNNAMNRQTFQQGAGATANGFSGRRSGSGGGGFTAGQVISKDVNSITVQLNNNGGSKIVFFSATTQISKYATSTIDQLKTGEQVIVNGSANSDGSITAQSIQLDAPIPQRTQSAQGQ
ncbi:MAG: hypothetical protein D4Q79_00090 [Spirochaetia bacterium]|nr:MAG: hypothetical protein D4Q79_00090 [Spirochaetia bacterium]